MKAVIAMDYGAPDVLEIAELADPEPGASEVRIRVEAAAVNPADVKWRAGMFCDLVPMSFPMVLGYDVAGVIDSIGPNVGGFASGDRVLAMLDPVRKGGYAGLAIATASSVAHCPAVLSTKVAAAIPTAALTGFQLIEQHVRPAAGQAVLITGATGAVGRYATYAAITFGATVIAAVRERHRAAALALGASEVVVLDDASGTAPPFDHVADTVGGEAVARLCRQMPTGGRIRTVATTPIDAAGLVDTPLFVAVQPDGTQLQQIAALVASGKLSAPIDHELDLDQAAEAHRLVEKGGLAGKIILRP